MQPFIIYAIRGRYRFAYLVFAQNTDEVAKLIKTEILPAENISIIDPTIWPTGQLTYLGRQIALPRENQS